MGGPSKRWKDSWTSKFQEIHGNHRVTEEEEKSLVYVV